MQKYLDMLHSAKSKQELRAVLLGIIGAIVAESREVLARENASKAGKAAGGAEAGAEFGEGFGAESKNADSSDTHNKPQSIFYQASFLREISQHHDIFIQIFSIFRDKLFGILDSGDILDSAFLYLAFIAPADLELDERFLPFIRLADKMLARHSSGAASQANMVSPEEWVMLTELGAIARVLYAPMHQSRSIFASMQKSAPCETSATIKDKIAESSSLESDLPKSIDSANPTSSSAPESNSLESSPQNTDAGAGIGANASANANIGANASALDSGISKSTPSIPSTPSAPCSTRATSYTTCAPRDALDSSPLDSLMFFTTNMLLTSMESLSASQCSKFIMEAFEVFKLGFSLLKPALRSAFARASSPIMRRNICNWQLHIFWNIPHLFNNREWLCLYDLWKSELYKMITRAESLCIGESGAAKSSVAESNTPESSIDSSAPDSALSSALDEVLYMQFFIYHMCGNSFSAQEQWRAFNDEISKKTTPLYKAFSDRFLPKLDSGLDSSLEPSAQDFAPQSTLESSAKSATKSTPESTASQRPKQPKQPAKQKQKRIVIGFLRDRIVENSPFKIEYSLFKNLLSHEEFAKRYEIKIYCMSLIEKSENNPIPLAKIASLGIETIDIGLGFNKAGFYNSHLQKALALREIIQKDDVQVLISPNNGYGISDFLLASRSARVQVFYTHGNFVYDICGIDARMTHICDNQREIIHEGFNFYGIPVKMDDEFYTPTLPPALIESERAKYPLDKKIMGVIGRLTKIDSTPYLRAICEILAKREDWIYLACGLGNEQEIRRKIDAIAPELSGRFFFSGYVDSGVYGHIIDFWADSFPMEQGESRIEYVAKSRGLALRYYRTPESSLLAQVANQLESTRGVIEEICADSHALSEILGEGDAEGAGAECAGVGAGANSSAYFGSGARGGENRARLFDDFASYKSVAIEFFKNLSAFDEAEYVAKALAIAQDFGKNKNPAQKIGVAKEESLVEVDSVKKADSVKNSGADIDMKRLLQIQSALHRMSGEIKSRLGERYFLDFLHRFGV